ncbi:ABC transporter permease [Sphingomonas arenae]|uniref:ABC transporter permease n=1 Tax=Sphingomonas arenae TaxID=2812555 RepID=UPI001967B248|nr:ABC transporter permease [Sphingomonas arenae]
MTARHLISSAFVIGRRDFTATVFSKSFLFFLLGPLFPLLVGILFGGIGASVANDAERPLVAVLAPSADYARLQIAHDQVAKAVDGSIIRLQHVAPKSDLATQRKALLEARETPARAVLESPFGSPRLTGSIQPDGSIAGQVQLILAQARADSAPALAVTRIETEGRTTASERVLVARAGQALLFLLTLLLAGMLLSQLIEEKSNKVIEVLAAAVPVDAIFLGKLFAMLAMSLLGITVWASAAVAGIALLLPGAPGSLPEPALGWPAFAALCAIYFAMSYLLIGSAFLGIGAQASTVRQVQTLSMPITMAQVVIFAIASAAAGNLNGTTGLIAAVFPLSSPFAMVARAAESDAWWPHLLALAWQLLWVALILRLAARFFRRSVLKSGPAGRPWFRRRSAAAV